MHAHWWFRKLHREHHKSHRVSPWTAYSFSVGEAAVQACFVVVIFLLPVPAGATVIFAGVALLLNAIGHCGVEVFPVWIVDHPRLKLITGVTHHDIHHTSPSHNFGLYFRFWDRLMGTEDPRFTAIYRYVRGAQNDGRAYIHYPRSTARAIGSSIPALDGPGAT